MNFTVGTPVIPAKAGIQINRPIWMPIFIGMTKWIKKLSLLPQLNTMENISRNCPHKPGHEILVSLIMPAIFTSNFKDEIMTVCKKMTAEMLGTAWLVLGGCGSAVFAAAFPDLGIGFVGVALAFGLSVLTAAYAVGHISGGHFNPAVTIGLVAGGRFDAKEAIPYIIAQLVGATVGAGIIYLIATGKPDFSMAGGFAANGYGEHSPGGYSLQSAFITEAVLTFFFLFIIIGSTDARAPAGFAPIAIGLALTLIHLISIPITNTSVNPARSTSQAIFEGGWSLDQLWLFWVAPILGAVVAGVVSKCCRKCEEGGCGCKH